MRTFFIFTKKEHPTKVIDNNFSKISFVFGLFWGLNKGLWGPVIVNFVLFLILSFYSADLLTGFIFLSNIFWGFFGKDLLIQKYLKKKLFSTKYSKCFIRRESTVNSSNKK